MNKLSQILLRQSSVPAIFMEFVKATDSKPETPSELVV